MIRRASVVSALLLAALAGSGCSNQVALSDPQLPEPLLYQLPITVAVRYAPEMEDYRYEEEVLGRQKWTIQLGASNRMLFEHLFGSMFSEVVEVGDGTDPAEVGADALLEVGIDAFEFALPAQSRSDAYTVWIRYRLRAFDAEGTEIANWPISAYGKAADDGMFGADTALKRAAVLAMRDAAATVSLRFAREIGLGDPGGQPRIPFRTQDEAETTKVRTADPETDAEEESSGAPTEAQPAEPAADVAANTNQGNFTDETG